MKMLFLKQMNEHEDKYVPREWKIFINDEYIDYIRREEKLYEGRRYYGNVRHYKVGDVLLIHSTSKKDECVLRVTIYGIHLFPTFRHALNELPLKEILPNVNNVEDGVKIYHQFVSQETQEKDGVCMIRIK